MQLYLNDKYVGYHTNVILILYFSSIIEMRNNDAPSNHSTVQATFFFASLGLKNWYFESVRGEEMNCLSIYSLKRWLL